MSNPTAIIIDINKPINELCVNIAHFFSGSTAPINFTACAVGSPQMASMAIGLIEDVFTRIGCFNWESTLTQILPWYVSLTDTQASRKNPYVSLSQKFYADVVDPLLVNLHEIRTVSAMNEPNAIYDVMKIGGRAAVMVRKVGELPDPEAEKPQGSSGISWARVDSGIVNDQTMIKSTRADRPLMEDEDVGDLTHGEVMALLMERGNVEQSMARERITELTKHRLGAEHLFKVHSVALPIETNSFTKKLMEDVTASTSCDNRIVLCFSALPKGCRQLIESQPLNIVGAVRVIYPGIDSIPDAGKRLLNSCTNSHEYESVRQSVNALPAWPDLVRIWRKIGEEYIEAQRVLGPISRGENFSLSMTPNMLKQINDFLDKYRGWDIELVERSLAEVDVS